MFFWIAVVLGVIATLWSVGAMVSNSYSLTWKILGVPLGLFMGALISLFMFLIVVGGANIFLPKETTQIGEEKVNIRAIETSDSTKGSVYLTAGYIDEKKVFDYIVENPDGSMEFKRIDADAVVLRESADEKPSITTLTYEESNPWLGPFPMSGYSKYEIVIPENSVREEFSVQSK